MLLKQKQRIEKEVEIEVAVVVTEAIEEIGGMEVVGETTEKEAETIEGKTDHSKDATEEMTSEEAKREGKNPQRAPL